MITLTDSVGQLNYELSLHLFNPRLNSGQLLMTGIGYYFRYYPYNSPHTALVNSGVQSMRKEPEKLHPTILTKLKKGKLKHQVLSTQEYSAVSAFVWNLHQKHLVGKIETYKKAFQFVKETTLTGTTSKSLFCPALAGQNGFSTNHDL